MRLGLHIHLMSLGALDYPVYIFIYDIFTVVVVVDSSRGNIQSSNLSGITTFINLQKA